MAQLPLQGLPSYFSRLTPLRRGRAGKDLASADHVIFKRSERFGEKITFTLLKRRGSAVAVRAMTGILGKNALIAGKSLNSLLILHP